MDQLPLQFSDQQPDHLGLFRNMNSWAQPRHTESQTQGSGPAICILTNPPMIPMKLKCETLGGRKRQGGEGSGSSHSDNLVSGTDTQHRTRTEVP